MLALTCDGGAGGGAGLRLAEIKSGPALPEAAAGLAAGAARGRTAMGGLAAVRLTTVCQQGAALCSCGDLSIKEAP